MAVNSLSSLTDYDAEMLDEDDNRKQSRLSTYYRSLLLPRFNNAELYDEAFDEPQFEEDAARKASIYQGLSTVSNYILRSEFGELYRQTLDRFRSLRDLLTLRVSRQQDGDYGVGKGVGERSRLFELRLTPNTQTGIEPRLRISEDFLLKYNSDESAPILEYSINF